MRRLKGRKSGKKSKVLLLVGALVFFFTIFLFKTYSNMGSKKIIDISYIKLQEFMEGFLSDNIGYDILNKERLEDILVINRNKSGEILYVDYDLDKAYKVLDSVTTTLEGLISDLEVGKYDVSNTKSIINGTNGIALKIPFLAVSNSAFLANLGPSIYVPVNFAGSILTNIKSKISDYGINNALMELYVTIKLSVDLISPVSTKNVVIDYDVLIASKVINGRVPEVYGGLISSKSNVVSIPIE